MYRLVNEQKHCNYEEIHTRIIRHTQITEINLAKCSNKYSHYNCQVNKLVSFFHEIFLYNRANSMIANDSV